MLLGGGVAANTMLRSRLAAACAGKGLSLHLTPLAYSTDNAAMIAALGFHLLQSGHRAGLDLTASAHPGVGA